MFKTNKTYLSFIMRVFFLLIFHTLKYKVQIELPSLSRIPDRKHEVFENRAVWLHTPYSFKDPKYCFQNTPCLNKTTFSDNRRICREVYSCKENVGNFLLPAVVAVCEMSWEWHIQFIIGDVAKPTACWQAFL